MKHKIKALAETDLSDEDILFAERQGDIKRNLQSLQIGEIQIWDADSLSVKNAHTTASVLGIRLCARRGRKIAVTVVGRVS